MKLDAVELRLMVHYLTRAFESEKKQLKNMDEDTDEYVELANDLMVLDVLIRTYLKIDCERPGGVAGRAPVLIYSV